jgi:hypothetical protein
LPHPFRSPWRTKGVGSQSRWEQGPSGP